MNKRSLLNLILGSALLATTIAAPHTLAAKPTAKEAKIGTYVQILNAESNTVFENQYRYTHWVADLKNGPTCKETQLSPPSATGDSAPATYKEYRSALKKAPKLEFDAAALQMVTALEELRQPVIDAGEYYYSHKHLEDGCKRGKELHPILLAGWDKYAQADVIVRAFVENYNDQRDLAELAKAEKKYGKRLHYYHLKLTLDAKLLVRQVEAMARSPKPDVGAIRDKLAIFVQSLTDATAIVDKEKTGKNANALYEGGYEQLLTHAGWYKDAIGTLLRHIDEATNAKKAYRKEDKQRDMEEIIKMYNSMIDQSNNVGYSSAMK